MNQLELAKKTGIAQSTISTAERLGNGSGDTAAYAHACGVSAYWLETGQGDMLPATATATIAAPSPALQASNHAIATAQQAQTAMDIYIPSGIKALAVIYAAIAPEHRAAAIGSATQAMISYLSPHTTPVQDEGDLDTTPSEVRQSSKEVRKTL